MIVTALTCLGVGGFVGADALWARRLARSARWGWYTNQQVTTLEFSHRYFAVEDRGEDDAGSPGRPERYGGYLFREWQRWPWYGRFETNDDMGETEYCWLPRSVFLEALKQASGMDLGKDPSTWEAWFKAHPRRVWNPERGAWEDSPDWIALPGKS